MARKTDEAGTQAGIGWLPCRPGRHTGRHELAKRLADRTQEEARGAGPAPRPAWAGRHAGWGPEPSSVEAGMGRLASRPSRRGGRHPARLGPAGMPVGAPRGPAQGPAWAGQQAGRTSERAGMQPGMGRLPCRLEPSKPSTQLSSFSIMSTMKMFFDNVLEETIVNLWTLGNMLKPIRML